MSDMRNDPGSNEKSKSEKRIQGEQRKQMAKKLMEASEDKINRNIKDSVFCDLFGKPEYLLQLYRALHPEDEETSEDDLTIVTLSRVIIQTMYNDLGFLAGNRLLVLVEAQSLWTENIVVRFLIYLGETYRRYVEKNDLNLYNTKKVELPTPELYVIYTGDRAGKPEKISLRNNFFIGQYSHVDVEATVIYDSKAGDILNQFIVFSRIFDEQRKRYPDNRRRAIQETIRICREKDVLKAYLEQEEAATIMFSMMDQEKAYALSVKEKTEAAYKEGEAEGYKKGEAEGYEKGEAKGYEKGEAEGVRNQMIADAKGMYKAGLTPEQIAEIQRVSIDEVLKMLEYQE